MLHFLPRDRASPSARASADVQAGLAVEAAPGTSQLGCTRKATSVRRCTALWGDLSRPKPVRHKLTSCYTPLPRQSEPRRACQRLSPLASAVALYLVSCMKRPQPARHGACASQAFVLTSSQETASAVARSLARHAKAGYVLEDVAGLSHHGLAPMERGERPLVGAVALYGT